MTVTYDDREDEASADALRDILRGHNEAFIGPSKRDPFAFYARDEQGRVVGGLRGMTVWSWAFVDWLAVDAAQRGSGIGQELLARAEGLARERGCVGVYLYTASFQAPQFYARLGYTEFGRLDDHPKGHTCHWVQKRL